MSQTPRTRVLVVDDEPSVLLEIAGALKRHYDVLTAQSAEEAEGLLAKERIDLLLTDLRLPGKDGLHLLEAAKAQSPDLPVVIMSGYFSKISPQALDELGQIELLAKPFTTDELAHAVHRALHPAEKVG